MRPIQSEASPPYEFAGVNADLQAVARRWRVLVVCAVSAVLLAGIFLMLRPERYQAEADLLVTPVKSDSSFAEATLNFALLRDPGGTVFTAGRSIGRPQVVDAVLSRLELPYNQEELRSMVTIEPIEQSGIVAITVKAPTAREAADIANTFVAVAVDQRTAAFQEALGAEIDRVQARLDELSPEASASPTVVALNERLISLRALVGSNDPTLAPWSAAVPPDHPVPVPSIVIPLAGIVGLLVGISVALVLDRLDRRVREGSEELDRLPTLGRIPSLPTAAARRYLADVAAERLPEQMWDAYRVLRANLDIRPHAHAGPLTVLVTSGGEADGKTMTAINLAIALSASGASVVVIDAELRQPGIARAFGLEPATDELANLLFGRLHLGDAVHRPMSGGAGLGIIASASETPSFVDMLVPASLERLRDQIGTMADILVIDTSPVPQAADALAWAAIADVALIAVREQHSRLEDVDSAVQCLAGRSVPTIGFVVTTTRRARGDLVDPPASSSAEPGPARRRARASVIEQS